MSAMYAFIYTMLQARYLYKKVLAYICHSFFCMLS